MKAYVATSSLGVFACDEKGKIVEHVLFKKDPFFIANKIKNSLESKELCEEEEIIVKKLKEKGFDEIVFEVEKNDFKHQFPNVCGEKIRKKIEDLAKKFGFAKDRKDFVRFMSEVSFNYSKIKMKEEDVEDRVIILMSEAIDDLNKAINSLVVRLREWYGLYYPELVEERENEEIVEYIVNKLYRDEDSVGHDLNKEDLEVIRTYAKKVKELYELREKMEKELDKKMRKVMPNVTEIVGAGVASKLLSLAGSLEKLAKFPSSTLQVLGAEKALFRFLSGKGKAPKHGVIFLTRYVQEVPKKYRGKIARKLASKLSIAAKVDYFDKGKKFIGDELKKALEEEIKKIKSGVKK